MGTLCPLNRTGKKLWEDKVQRAKTLTMLMSLILLSTCSYAEEIHGHADITVNRQIEAQDIMQIDALNNLSNTVSMAAFYGNMVSIFNTQAMLESQREQMRMQDRWNQWNGMVSVLNEKQKQMVLDFNTRPENNLVKMWWSLRKNKVTLPMAWLTPVKQDLFYNSMTSFLKNDLNVEEFLDYTHA